MSAFGKPSHSASAIDSRNGRIRDRHTAPAGVAVLVASILLVLVALATASSAVAAPTPPSAFVYSHAFATEGQLFGLPNGIAVEPGTGNVVVVSNGIAVFAPDSAPTDAALTTFDNGDSVGAVAVDPASGAVYVQGFTSLTRWISDGAPVPTYTLDSSYAADLTDHLGGIAVDPTTGDLLVADPEANEVVRLGPSGARLSSFPTRASSESAHPFKVTVGSDGTIYVLDEFGVLGNVVTHYTATGERLGTLPVVGIPLVLTLDPVSGGTDVSVERSDGTLWVEGFDPSGERVSEVEFPELPAESMSFGLALDGESGHLYALTGGFGPPPGIRVFDSVPSPGTEAPTVSAITATAAQFEAEVDPGEAAGGGVPNGSFAYFEYSRDGGKTWPGKTPSQDLTEEVPVKVQANPTGLHPNEKYLVRTVVGNEVSRHVTNPTPFTTVAVAPITTTGSATDIGETTAVINGTIDPASLQATYHFEYGLSTAYGSRLPAGIEADAGNGHAPRIFSRTLRGLQPGTTYHYRLVATNSVGSGEGEDRTFTTAAAGAVPARAYEQVTPVDKLGSTIDVFAFQASPDGSAFSYIARSPAGGESSPQSGRFMSYRGAGDWDSGHPTDPPLNTARNVIITVTLGISDDYSHAFVVSNRDLNGDGAENGANLYREDLRTGQYTLAASTNFKGAFEEFTAIGQSPNKFVWGNSDYSEVIFISVAPLLPGAGPSQIYRWSVGGGLQLESVLPDGSTPSGGVVVASPAGAPRYVSDDGRRTYFTTLGGSENGIFLREGGKTRAISVSHRAGDPTTPQEGIFLTASKDGRYGFFYTLSASVQLTDDAPEVEGNIYRYDAVTGELQYIGDQVHGPGSQSAEAMLGVSDDGRIFYFIDGGPEIEVWREGALHAIADGTEMGLGNGFVSPSGRYLGFREGTVDGGSVFLFDDASEQLACASCLSDGSDPGGAELPVGQRQVSNQMPSVVDDRGQLFFDTPARLVAADANGTRDVYVFEHGQPRLISPGNAPFDAVLGDISADGNDVFFTTSQKLVGRDNDRATDVYDARVNGGFPAQSPPPPQECLRDDCKATPNAGPELPFGGSEALSGPGNVAAPAHKHCGKGTHVRKVKGKQRCVKQGKKKHAKHAKKQKAKQGTKQAKSNRRQAR